MSLCPSQLLEGIVVGSVDIVLESAKIGALSSGKKPRCQIRVANRNHFTWHPDSDGAGPTWVATSQTIFYDDPYLLRPPSGVLLPPHRLRQRMCDLLPQRSRCWTH